VPLKALLNGQPFYAWNLTEAHREKEFRCPHCDDVMIPVIPISGIINHFRHKNNQNHTEPETPEHLAGKFYIMNNLSRLGFEVDVEQKLGHHICDVLVRIDDHPIVIEYQCSPITIDEVKDRHRTYDVPTYWILGTYYYKRATRFFAWKDGEYYIQRISKFEKMVGRIQPLIYLYNQTLYRANWKTRKHSEYLGWYNLHEVSPLILVGLIRGDLDFTGPFTKNMLGEDRAAKLAA